MTIDTGYQDESDLLVAARVEAHRAFAANTPTGRNAVWWAMVIGLVGVGHIAGAFVYSYYYLRLGADSWPIEGTDLRSWMLPAVALAGAVVALVISHDATRGRAVLALSVVIATAALVVQITSLILSGYQVDANAYEALVVTIEVLAALLLTTAIGLRVAAVIFHRPNPRPSGLFDADAALWKGGIGLWIVLWAVLHLSPRVI